MIVRIYTYIRQRKIYYQNVHVENLIYNQRYENDQKQNHLILFNLISLS